MGEGRKPRLVYVVTEDWFFYSHFMPMGRKAQELGFEVNIVTHVRDHGKLLRREGFEVYHQDSRRGSMRLSEILFQIRSLRRRFREQRPTIVHLIALKPIVLGGIAAILTGIPGIVYAITGLGYLSYTQTMRARMVRAVLYTIFPIMMRRSRSYVILENSNDAEWVAKHVANAKASIVIVGGAGVDPDFYAEEKVPSDDGGVVVGLVARMISSKGLEIAVEAHQRLRARFPTLRLILAGMPDPENPNSIPLATLQRWNTLPGIEWIGQSEDVRQVWRRAHIAVLPSHGGEGLPQSILEAAACSRPIVTTNVPGCRDFVRHGIEGLIVPPNDVGALENALARLLKSPEVRRTMGMAARKRVLSRFTEQHVTEKIALIYKDLDSTLETIQ